MGEDDFSISNFIKDVTPIYGTIRDYNNMIEDPTLGNIGMFTLSAAGDIPFVGAGFKALKAAAKAAKAAKNLSKLEKTVKTATRVGVARRAYNRQLRQYRDFDVSSKIEQQILLNEAKRNVKEGIGINAAQEYLRRQPYYNIKMPLLYERR